MKKFFIFILTIGSAFFIAKFFNSKLEQKTLGSSLQAFKDARIKGMSSVVTKQSDHYDVLVFGDSLLEILFEPVEFDQTENTRGKVTKSWNLALRSMTTEDFHTISSNFSKTAKFESCIVQVPVLHLSAKKRGSELLNFWPGRGLSDYLNLWNPLSRQDHGFDSPANLWTGAISQSTLPWNEERRGGMNLAESSHLPELRQALLNPRSRALLNKAYDRVMGLSQFKFDPGSVHQFSEDVRGLRETCEKIYVLWPLFSPELNDRSIGPDPAELVRLRQELSKQLELPIHDLPWDAKETKFLDSQHIDPSYRGEFHKWLAEVI